MMHLDKIWYIAHNKIQKCCVSLTVHSQKSTGRVRSVTCPLQDVVNFLIRDRWVDTTKQAVLTGASQAVLTGASQAVLYIMSYCIEKIIGTLEIFKRYKLNVMTIDIKTKN